MPIGTISLGSLAIAAEHRGQEVMTEGSLVPEHIADRGKGGIIYIHGTKSEQGLEVDYVDFQYAGGFTRRVNFATEIRSPFNQPNDEKLEAAALYAQAISHALRRTGSVTLPVPQHNQ